MLSPRSRSRKVQLGRGMQERPRDKRGKLGQMWPRENLAVVPTISRFGGVGKHYMSACIREQQSVSHLQLELGGGTGRAYLPYIDKNCTTSFRPRQKGRRGAGRVRRNGDKK